MTIVLSIAGLGARWLGCYGNEWVATPHFDRLASEGVVYDNCYTTDLTPLTPPAGATLLRAKRGKGSPFESLRNEISKRKFNGDELIWIESDALTPPWNAPAELFEDYYEGDAEPITDPKPGDDFDVLHASFAAAVTLLDADSGAVRECFPADANWIVTSPHGYPLGEHGVIGPGTLHEEAVHVPLIAALSKTQTVAHRVLDLAKASKINNIINNNMLESSNNMISKLSFESISQQSIRTSEWSLIQDIGEPRLYHRPADRLEMTDVARMHPEIIEELLKTV